MKTRPKSSMEGSGIRTLLGGLGLSLLLWGAGAAGAADAVLQAYDQLVASHSFPKSPTEADRQAMELIRQRPQSILPRIEKSWSFGSTPDGNTLGIFYLLPESNKLAVARSVARTYPAAQRTPVSLFLAAKGGTNDMEKIHAEIAAQPDGWGISLAVAIVEHKNEAGLKKLGEIKGQTKGAWQDVPSVKAALSKQK